MTMASLTPSTLPRSVRQPRDGLSIHAATLDRPEVDRERGVVAGRSTRLGTPRYREDVDGRLRSRILGCLVGGAVGDALGALDSSASGRQISAALGLHGVTEDPSPVHFTDNTQMVLFTCQALIRATLELEAVGICDPAQLLHDAYRLWLVTQGSAFDEVRRADGPRAPSGWLVHEPSLHRRAAPHQPREVLQSGLRGTLSAPLNNSKGCAGVVRAAPAGIMTVGVPVGESPAEAYHLGCEVAAITEGHPNGIHPAGLLAALVHVMVAGAGIRDAIDQCRLLAPMSLQREIDAAVRLGSEGLRDPETLSAELGAGSTGDEAIAIALACAVGARSFEEGIMASTTHGGETASTGAICGNLLGAVCGDGAVPARVVSHIESIDLVEAVALDVALVAVDRPSATEISPTFAHLFERYVSE